MLNKNQVYTLKMTFYYEEVIAEKETILAILQALQSSDGIALQDFQSLNQYLSNAYQDSSYDLEIDFEHEIQMLQQQIVDSQHLMRTNTEREGIQLP